MISLKKRKKSASFCWVSRPDVKQVQLQKLQEMEPIIKILEFIFDSFLHIWPYLVISIPLAVAVQVSGAAKFINRALSRKPLMAIFLATLVGAFSPFCSCGVVPIIASLLMGGVPLAPVMAFWIASPSMDPEIFFLSTATIGWNLSVWRLAATFTISLFAGYFTHFAMQRGLVGNEVLRTSEKSVKTNIIKLNLSSFLGRLSWFPGNAVFQPALVTTGPAPYLSSCCAPAKAEEGQPETQASKGCAETTCDTAPAKDHFQSKLLRETRKATIMVFKFMALAFFVNALITFYVPQDLIAQWLGGNSDSSVFLATLIGIPAYTSNLTALPLVSGLLSLGMDPGAALSFLIAGPTTTLPAMVAVYGLTRRRIFLLYISFSLTGAILFGLLFNLFN